MSFKKVRERSGITQVQIAAEFGIDQSTVSLWESGKTHPRAKLLPKLAKFLECTIDEILAPDAVES